jgi:hypothetical protein
MSHTTRSVRTRCASSRLLMSRAWCKRFSATWARGMTRLPEDLHRALRDPTPTKRVTTWTRPRNVELNINARLRERAHGLRRIPTLPGRNAGVRLRTAVSGVDQGPTAPARGQSAPGLRTPPAKTPSPRAKNAQESGKNCRLTSPHPSVDIAPCLVRPKNQFSFTRAALSTCGCAKSKFL